VEKLLPGTHQTNLKSGWIWYKSLHILKKSVYCGTSFIQWSKDLSSKLQNYVKGLGGRQCQSKCTVPGDNRILLTILRMCAGMVTEIWIDSNRDMDNDNLRPVNILLKHYCRSVTFWHGSGSDSADPCLWLTDPDPAMSLTFKAPTKTIICLSFSADYFLKVHLNNFSKIKSDQEVTKQ
jgi:hypothetical protein